MFAYANQLRPKDLKVVLRDLETSPVYTKVRCAALCCSELSVATHSRRQAWAGPSGRNEQLCSTCLEGGRAPRFLPCHPRCCGALVCFTPNAEPGHLHPEQPHPAAAPHPRDPRHHRRAQRALCLCLQGVPVPWGPALPAEQLSRCRDGRESTAYLAPHPSRAATADSRHTLQRATQGRCTCCWCSASRAPRRDCQPSTWRRPRPMPSRRASSSPARGTAAARSGPAWPGASPLC